MPSIFLQKLDQRYLPCGGSRASVYSTSLPSSSSKTVRVPGPCLLRKHVTASVWLMEYTRLLRPRALKAKLTDTRCKSSLTSLNVAMKGAYPVLLASKHSAHCQRVYEEEILSNTAPLTLTCVCYSSMPIHPNPKLMLSQSRPALTQLIMLEFRQNTKEYSVPKTMFQWPISFCIISIF